MARRAEPLQAAKPLPRPERVAALLLIAKAYRILARRWKTPFGEIDIVARRRGVVVFVEVKARASIDEAVEAVTDRTKHRVIAAAELWLARHPQHANGGVRFDVIVVAPGKIPRHIVNAFIAEVV